MKTIDIKDPVIERIRLVILTREEIRAALRLEAARRGEDMSDVATAILAEALADALAEVRALQKKRKKGDA
jgi:hypothetical protein